MPGFRVSIALFVLAPALALCVACPASDDVGADTSGVSAPQTMSQTGPAGSDDDPSDPSDPSNSSDANPSDPSDPSDPGDTTGAAGAGCCSPHVGSGCDEPAIEACVCEDDAVCCTFDWDELCVNAARNRCGACGGGGLEDSGSTGPDATTSAGSDSSDGGPMTAATTIDPTGDGEACCDTTPTPGCPGDAALEACVCGLDEYCCMREWDTLCVQQAAADCMADCQFGTGCCEIHPSPGCDNAPVETCVCALDPFCCENEWDGQCVGEVESEQCGNC